MFSKKLAIFAAFTSVLFLNFNNIYVRENFEQPFNYKLTHGIVNVFGNIVRNHYVYFLKSLNNHFYKARLLVSLKIAPEYKIVRDAVDYVSVLGINQGEASKKVSLNSCLN